MFCINPSNSKLSLPNDTRKNDKYIDFLNLIKNPMQAKAYLQFWYIRDFDFDWTSLLSETPTACKIHHDLLRILHWN